MAGSKKDAILASVQDERTHTMGAHALRRKPYFNSKLGLDPGEYLHVAHQLDATVQVFYLSAYIRAPHVPRLLTRVPYICTGGDRHIQLQNGERFNNLAACHKAHPGLLIGNDERRVARHKSVASVVTVFAKGGYKVPLDVFDARGRFECIVVSGAAPQFEATYLDYADFIVSVASDSPAHGPRRTSSTRQPVFKHYGAIPDRWSEVELASGRAAAVSAAVATAGAVPPTFVDFGTPHQRLHAAGLLASLHECVHLWLAAFDAMVAARRPAGGRCGYFKLVAAGTGFFADVAHSGGLNIGGIVAPLLLRATCNVLERAAGSNSGGSHTYPHLAAVEFPDFSASGAFTPPAHYHGRIGPVRLVAAPRRDVLDFPPDVWRDDLVPGVLNPGDCFSLVGNETSYDSVEAMLGCNSTLRINQNYVWNRYVLDRDRHVAVKLPWV